ncbi:MAG: hypothetical protein NT026_02085, partial [Candidatus Staskawiczbacteria bacterium]|nr:hypothetical protein [Candidatus Staskawiczbacteria bacterium]
MAKKKSAKRKPAKKRAKKKSSAQKIRKSAKGPAIDPKQLENLLLKGEERGFVTTSEILYAFPKIERDIEGLEKVYDNFKDRGVVIKEAQEFLETKKQKEKKGRKALAAKIDP